MKFALIIFSLLILVLIILLFIKGVNSRSGATPGLDNGKLTQCSSKPNCVCSEYIKDAKHYIKPILLTSDASSESLPILKGIILAMGGRIHTEDKNYLSSKFSSNIFGFVDDLEIRLDSEDNAIHFRSSSRVGTSDFGVNRNRVNTLKTLYKEKTTKNNL